MRHLFVAALTAAWALVVVACSTSSAKPGEIVEGTVIFGHEVRAFRPAGSDTEYWLIDKSGCLQEKYKASGQPEWEAEAKLEVKNVGKLTDGFGEDYESAYEVLRVISVEDKR